MERNDLIKTLERWNIWERNRDVGILRPEYIENLSRYLQDKEILVLKGIRRCGKSTIVQQLMQKLVESGVERRQVLYVNLEDYNFINELSLEFLDELLLAYKEHTENKKRVYFFIDEIQAVEGWERWVRTYYDRGDDIKFIVTGSNASLLSKELSTLLTGRSISFTIYPLSYKEFLSFKKNSSFEEYLEFGGFPAVVLKRTKEKKNALLEEYFSTIIHRDIIERHAVRNPKQLFSLARHLVSTPGSKVSVNKLSKTFGVAKDTLAVYIGYLVDVFLLQEVPFFSFSAKKRYDVAKLPKYYVLDNGFVNMVNVKYSQNLGWLYENSVLIHLARQFQEVNYWSDGSSEVDFVVEKVAINVTATDDVPEREYAGIDAFAKKHKGFAQILITKREEADMRTPIEKFLLR
ncbi:MAG: ATP-binding protein [Candidatus Woesearchaeota archaeon]|nr:ATP-binding protein [Candidatus Woesearchaeota archaeon]